MRLPWRAAQGQAAGRLERLRQFGKYLEKVTHQTEVGDLKDRRLGILVDRDDYLRVLHAGKMLNGAGDAAGNVEVGRDHLASLPDLEVVRRITGIDGGARRADRGAELVGNRFEILPEVLGRLEGAAAGNDDACGGKLRTLAPREFRTDEGREVRRGRGRNRLDRGDGRSGRGCLKGG